MLRQGSVMAAPDERLLDARRRVDNARIGDKKRRYVHAVFDQYEQGGLDQVDEYARVLGVRRTSLRRLLSRHFVTDRSFVAPARRTPEFSSQRRRSCTAG